MRYIIKKSKAVFSIDAEAPMIPANFPHSSTFWPTPAKSPMLALAGNWDEND